MNAHVKKVLILVAVVLGAMLVDRKTGLVSKLYDNTLGRVGL